MSVSFLVPLLLCIALASGSRSVSALTYNVDFDPRLNPLEHYSEVVASINSVSADFICLEELWLVKDQQQLAKDVAENYPYTHTLWPLNQTSNPVACSSQSIVQAFGLCYAQNCLNVTDLGARQQCTEIKCTQQFVALLSLGPQCAYCLEWQVALGNANAFTYCLTDTTYSWLPTGSTMMLSKHPLTNLKTQILPSTDLPRAYMYAEANLPDWGDVAVLCVHLTALPYQGAPYQTPSGTNFTTFQEESLFQLDAALAQLSAPGTPANKILMGDFNSSPSVPALAISPTLVLTIETMLSSSWSSQSLLSSGLQPRDICTWCRDNINAQIGPDGAVNQVIDWIHVQGFAADSGEELVDVVERKFDEILSDGTMISDHYSIMWTRETAPTCSDGVMNGNEQGVDCGGNCTSCIAAENCPPTTCIGGGSGVAVTAMVLVVLNLVWILF